jgi:hypothetical protein
MASRRWAQCPEHFVVVIAAVPLACGIALDLYVACAKATQSSLVGIAVAAGCALIMAFLWFAYPFARAGMEKETP